MCLLCYLENEDKLTADFAEYYHVLDWQSIPLDTAATLAAELRPSSRSYMAAKGLHVNMSDTLLARIYDALQVLIYQHAGKKAQKPKLVSDDLIRGKSEKENDTKAFKNADDFEEAWRNLNG